LLNITCCLERKLVGLSVKKKYHSPNLFTWGHQTDHAAQLFRPKNSQNSERIPPVRNKTYIPPEFQGMKHDPVLLPTFLREQLDIKVDLRARTQKHQMEDFYLSPSKNEKKERSQSLEGKNVKPIASVDKLRRKMNDNEPAFNIEDIISEMNSQRNSMKKQDTIEYQYLSPKARQQVKEDRVPVLLSNVFLTGMVNPEGGPPRNETTVEHILSEHHNKLTHGGESSPKPLTEEKRKRLFTKSSVNLTEQNKRKDKMSGFIQRESKEQLLGRMETQMEAAVGQLKMEREARRKKVLRLLRTKNFNLFKPSTINNMHLLKDAFRKT